MILGDALQRIADEADVALLKIVEAAEIIEDLAGQRIGGKRVDREVAPRRVLLPVVGEGDGRAPAVGRDVAAKRRDFERVAVADGSDRAMIDAGRNGLDLAPSRAVASPRRAAMRVARSTSLTGRPSRSSRTAPPT